MLIDIFNTTERYNVIYIDPPYSFSQGINPRKKYSTTVKEEINLHYATMSDKQIIAFDFSNLSAEQCAVFCWTTDAHLPIALKMLENNGFTYKTVAFVWNKRRASMGKWNVKQCEICLLATKGTVHKLLKTFKERQYIEKEKTRHSEKPNEIRERITRMFGDVPKIELFARHKSLGWDYWGNEVEE